jgi:type VI secretion system protein ImpJ
VRDAVHGGADAEEIEIARPQALLLAPGSAAGGYTALPVAQPEGLRADGGVALAEAFLPPALVTAAHPFYGRLLQELVTGVERIAEAHGKMVLGGPGRSVENLLVLELANAARPRLAHMLEQDVFHPGELYLELAGLAGRMATYGSGSRRLSELPAYDHMAPGPAFAALADTLRSLILSLRYVEPKSRALQVMKHSAERLEGAHRQSRDAEFQPDRAAGRQRAVRRGAAQDLRQPGDGRCGGRVRGALEGAGCPASRLKPLHSHPREIPYDGDRLCLELDQKIRALDIAARRAGLCDRRLRASLPGEPQLDCYSVNR